jgi:hypothetical protein
MSNNIQECETYLDLIEWVRGNLPEGSLHVNESGEVIIHIGLALGMDGNVPMRLTFQGSNKPVLVGLGQSGDTVRWRALLMPMHSSA